MNERVRRIRSAVFSSNAYDSAVARCYKMSIDNNIVIKLRVLQNRLHPYVYSE